MRKNLIKKSLSTVRAKALANLPGRFSDLEYRLAQFGESLAKLDNNPYSGPNHESFAISPELAITKIFSGLKMYLDPRDIAVAPHIILDGIWEEHITKAWLSVIKDGDTVFDIGANFGYFGALSAQVLDKQKSRIVMFEANPGLIPYLNKTLSVNWFNENTKVENLAISDKNGTAELTVLKDYIGCSSLQTLDELGGYLHDKMDLVAQEKIQVQAVTIDSYCDDNKIPEVDVIKLDIEGFEEKAYEGMRKVVKKSKHLKLFVEFTKEAYDDPEKFYNTLMKDFGHVQGIAGSGDLTVIKDKRYDSVMSGVGDWVMLVFSKDKLL